MASPSHCSCCSEKMFGWVELSMAGGAGQEVGVVWEWAGKRIVKKMRAGSAKRDKSRFNGGLLSE